MNSKPPSLKPDNNRASLKLENNRVSLKLENNRVSRASHRPSQLSQMYSNTKPQHLQQQFEDVQQEVDESFRHKEQPQPKGDNKKKELLQLLQYQISQLSSPCLREQDDDNKDLVMEHLEFIIKEAEKHSMREIAKMGELAVGKRILNLELTRRRAEVQKKQNKKREIEAQFRENRIANTNYERVALSRVPHNVMVIKPYPNGRGFNESSYFYEKVISRLTGLDFTHHYERSNAQSVVKEVNNIYFRNFCYYSCEKSRSSALTHPLIRLVYLLALAMLLLCLWAIAHFDDGLQWAIFGLNTVAVAVSMGLSVGVFRQGVSSNGQLDETIGQVKAYFQAVNEGNMKEGLPYRWHCPDSFMHLELSIPVHSETMIPVLR